VGHVVGKANSRRLLTAMGSVLALLSALASLLARLHRGRVLFTQCRQADDAISPGLRDLSRDRLDQARWADETLLYAVSPAADNVNRWRFDARRSGPPPRRLRNAPPTLSGA
jgi:hypothetical protein